MIPATCRNCDAPLTGPYCAQCGQHARESARSLGALLHDAWHVVTHVDGRFWATLRLLLLRPSELTLEYFAEHRARYVPPVRLYLVISIVFFGLASLTSHFRTAPVVAAQGGQPQAVADRVALERNAGQAALEARQAAAQGAAPDAAPAAPARADDEDDGFNFDTRDCDRVRVSPRWLQPALQGACRRALADRGTALKHAFVANIPKMMFVFLPLIAFVTQLLYWFPRRYYVEHLVFFLHNHAALFLAMSLEMPLDPLGRAVPALHRVAAVATFAVFGYALWYVYRSMRRYYGQGRWLTLAKFALVGLAYLVFLALTLFGTFLVSALIA